LPFAFVVAKHGCEPDGFGLEVIAIIDVKSTAFLYIHSPKFLSVNQKIEMEEKKLSEE